MTEFKVEKIFFDMDGVLADFTLGVKEMCNFIPPSLNDDKSKKEQDNLMWSKISEIEHFYDKLKLMPGAEKLFHAVYSKYGSKCEILTGIPRPERCIHNAGEDKKNWMNRMLSDDIKMNIVLRKEKTNYCKGKGYILIDDMQENIREWEAAGGTGIAYVNADDTLEQLRKIGVI